MTVAELKIKVYTEFEIPTNVQRWIIGKNLADRDETTLEELQAIDGSPIFLYLVAPELQKDSVVVQAGKSNSLEELSKVEKEIRQPEEKVITTKEEVKPTTVTPYDKQIEPEEEQTPEEVKMERYEELISLENCDVIPNSEAIECPICFVTYGPREGVILRDCLHMFCKLCIANTIKYCEDAEVKCPYRDTEYTCESTLQEREIKALVEAEVYQQHLAKSIAQAENNAGNNAFHCKTPDCPGWCYYDDDVNNFLCPVCGVNNCLTCQAAHTGKNCKQYQQELRLSKETDQESRRTAAMLEEMVDRGEALACPTCAVVLMKKWGCDWLKCSMCKTEICWVTRGPRWGPGGKGDTSGGCRCGENGVKCHPRCNYCH